MMLGEDQHAALVAALRNQPQYPRGNAAPSAQSIIQNGDALAKGYQDIKAAGNGDVWQGLQYKLNGLFGNGAGQEKPKDGKEVLFSEFV